MAGIQVGLTVLTVVGCVFLITMFVGMFGAWEYHWFMALFFTVFLLRNRIERKTSGEETQYQVPVETSVF